MLAADPCSLSGGVAATPTRCKGLRAWCLSKLRHLKTAARFCATEAIRLVLLQPFSTAARFTTIAQCRQQITDLELQHL